MRQEEWENPKDKEGLKTLASVTSPVDTHPLISWLSTSTWDKLYPEDQFTNTHLLLLLVMSSS